MDHGRHIWKCKHVSAMLAFFKAGNIDKRINVAGSFLIYVYMHRSLAKWIPTISNCCQVTPRCYTLLTCRQQISRGMWAMMTLLEVLDCSFSDSLVHRFSAPENRNTALSQICSNPSGAATWLCSGGGHVPPAIDYLAHLWRPTPWGPRRRHWLGNGAWGGSVPRTTPPCHAAPAAALTGCCWTVPAQSRAPPAQMPAATLRKKKAGEKWALKENKTFLEVRVVWTVHAQWINYLSCSITCPAAFWTHTHRGDRWMFYNRGWSQDWTEEKKEGRIFI